ncbi:hypothetical protein PC9H_009380 [Pleurotus ostreatus]|uniref:Nudix hydrolase domain-containing protein n=1 Tax=Pleurotus ostreatus TaxID=5322 RepID=A0A8H6ZPB3_PLEOS|nr:uncharacterized protein PC9H_009380 [Pleurotus ostreatus]KAF7424079.1 hypothetical protein PC9H_009380 [Pleurotus ostreatus]
MSTKGRSTPRIVCCAIPIARSAGKVLVVTSRKRPDIWLCECYMEAFSKPPSEFSLMTSVSVPKGGWEPSDGELQAAALREALEEAGVRGQITRFVKTTYSPSATYHFYELDVSGLDSDWPEAKERRREWVDYAEAIKRLEWKQELSEGLKMSTLAPRR